MNDQPTKLKRVVIKEELVELTGHYIEALLLNQFIYWSERTKDFDEFIQEERKRAVDSTIEVPPSDGWVYKTATELSAELMLNLAPNTIRRHLVKLIDSGFLHERRNPKIPWDRTKQYRPDMVKIQTGLQEMGYALESYPLVLLVDKMDNATSKMDIGASEMDIDNLQNGGTIPETTTETTTENMPPGGDGDFSDLFPEPLQAAPTIKKLDDNGQAHLLIFGVLPSDKTDPKEYEVKQQLSNAAWQIHSSDVELAIVYFLLAVRTHHPDFAIPNDAGTRRDWYKSVGAHLKNHPLSELQNLYKLAIIKMIDKDLSYWRPGSLTRWAIPEVANEPTLTHQGPQITDEQREARDYLDSRQGKPLPD